MTADNFPEIPPEIREKLRRWNTIRRAAMIRMASKPLNPILHEFAAHLIAYLAVEEAQRAVPLTTAEIALIEAICKADKLDDLTGRRTTPQI